jgi:hypothetical protein
LADAEGLNLSGRKAVRVRIPPRAPALAGICVLTLSGCLAYDERLLTNC